MLMNYDEYIIENKILDNIKNIFRSKDNPNVVAEELFDKIKKNLKKHIELIPKIEIIEKNQHIKLELSNNLKIEIILIFEEGKKPKKGLINIKKGKQNRNLEIDFNRTKRYIDYIEYIYKNKYDKGLKKLNSLETRNLIKKL